MLKADIEAFVNTQQVRATEDGEALLSRDDALNLLKIILQSESPRPAYVDIYSENADGKLHFEEDLTMRDFLEESLSSKQYWENILNYLGETDPESYVSLCDFS
ncbi:hypothetical protein Dcar01_02601 [Deinococcus carri]|uniref:Uncharacterized protein n=1 Tax=Deinococcus carri TaxID=1211323 RepID=A0ABP9W931_9DEIO